MNEQEQNKKLIKEHYAAIWGGNDDLIRQQIAPDFVDHGTPGDPKGVEPVIAFARGARAAFPDMKIIFNSTLAEGDRVAVMVTWSGTHRGLFLGIAATNKTIAFNGMVFWRIAEGRIAERWAMLDMAAIQRQLQG